MTPHFPFRSPLILLIGPSSFEPVQVLSNNSHRRRRGDSPWREEVRGVAGLGGERPEWAVDGSA